MYTSKKRAAVFIICILTLIIGLTGCSKDKDNKSESKAQTKSSDKVKAEIEIEDYGTITIQLDEEAAPETVENFKKLAGKGFYDGLTFHRIIDGFMIQGGDPLGNGAGGSDTSIKGEFSDNGVENNISHTRGTVSMARSSGLDSASSQFFIVQQDATYLDGEYAAFGEVISGIEVVDEICKSANPTDGNGTIPSEEQPVIKKIKILKK